LDTRSLILKSRKINNYLMLVLLIQSIEDMLVTFEKETRHVLYAVTIVTENQL